MKRRAAEAGTPPDCMKTLKMFYARILRKALGCQVFHPLSVHRDRIPSVPEDNSREFSWVFLDARELKGCLEPEHVTVTDQFIDEAFAKGDKCFGVLHDGRLAHYSWYSSRRTRVMTGVDMDFPGSWVYMYNAFTSPRFRGRKIYPKAVARALGSFFTDGFTTGVTLVGADNFSSLSPLKKIGFAEMGRMVVMGKGGTRSYTSEQCLRQGVKLVCTG